MASPGAKGFKKRSFYTPERGKMDIFVEQLVKKKRKIVDYATVVLIAMLGILLSFLSVLLVIMFAPFMLFFSFILVFAFIYLSIFAIRGTNLEFEYAVTNEYLVIDKIIAKRRRKNLVDIRINTIENFCKFTDKRLENIKINKNVYACEDYENDDTYVITYRDPKFGIKAVAFTPNEEVFKAMRPYLRREIVTELFLKK